MEHNPCRITRDIRSSRTPRSRPSVIHEPRCHSVDLWISPFTREGKEPDQRTRPVEITNSHLIPIITPRSRKSATGRKLSALTHLSMRSATPRSKNTSARHSCPARSPTMNPPWTRTSLSWFRSWEISSRSTPRSGWNSSPRTRSVGSRSMRMRGV